MKRAKVNVVDVVTVKMCPCCQNEEPITKRLYTKADYLGNMMSVDEQNRVLILCGDCKGLYDWTWENF